MNKFLFKWKIDAELFSDQMISDKFCYKGVLVRNKTIKSRRKTI